MGASVTHALLGRYTEIGELAVRMRAIIGRFLVPFTCLLVGESLYLLFSGHIGADAFAIIASGTILVLWVWSRGGIGLPLIPLMSLQSLLIYGLPIVANHETLYEYPPTFLLRAGIETLIWSAAMIGAWWAGMRLFRPSQPVSYALEEFNRAGAKGWSRLGFVMITVTTSVECILRLHVFDALISSLPAGSTSIITAFVTVVGACGFFLTSLVIGAGESSIVAQVFFWALFLASTMISAQELLLSIAAANIITVSIGLFWGGGRMPWRFLIIGLTVISFLNTGKVAMRARYWSVDGDPIERVTLATLPAMYVEWAELSVDAIEENSRAPDGTANQNGISAQKAQTLIDRVDNLQSLLYVIDQIETNHVSLLNGATYSLIPPLLIPRVLWPDKPRSHEGQVMLNVHFGRQDLESTFETYIAWGLLPEAYGNFGAIEGSLILGIFMGLLFSYIENITARKLILSLEGFLSLGLIMCIVNSFEMVASVLITSIFQAMVSIFFASLPFVRRTVNIKRRSADGSIDPEAPSEVETG